MIISHKHKLIFLHCRKAAGSSITVSLARDLGPFDIQIGGHRDAMTVGIRPNLKSFSRLATLRGGGRFIAHLRRGTDYRKAFNQAVKESYRPIDEVPVHALAKTLSVAFPREWRSYFKFCVVRNPFERVLSDYFWKTQKLIHPPSFAEFLRAMKKGERDGRIIDERPDNWEIYTINDAIAVDKVIRYENLQRELSELFSELGVDWDGWLPRLKVSKNRENQPLDIYSPDDVKLVQELFQKEIDTFGYSFHQA